jgi:AraC-like DNA-binding protein
MKSDLLAQTKPSGTQPVSISAELAVIEQLFDHVPETAFFLKDRQGRYLAVNQSLADRCGAADKSALVGRRVQEVFPRELGELYAGQDEVVLKTGRPIIDRLELHWYAPRQPGWCLTTKLPIRDEAGNVIGLAGISRDLRAPKDAAVIPAGLASTLDYLERNCDARISPSSLASRTGLSPVRFARLIKRIFRITPNQLIMQTRLAAAARLLIETDRSISDIACACGFYDHSAMTSAFRSATNLTPTQFRSLKRK